MGGGEHETLVPVLQVRSVFLFLSGGLLLFKSAGACIFLILGLSNLFCWKCFCLKMWGAVHACAPAGLQIKKNQMRQGEEKNQNTKGTGVVSEQSYVQTFQLTVSRPCASGVRLLPASRHVLPT